jgi:hypothetical protein
MSDNTKNPNLDQTNLVQPPSGMSDDLPDEMAIVVRPHFVSDLFENDEGRNQG